MAPFDHGAAIRLTSETLPAECMEVLFMFLTVRVCLGAGKPTSHEILHLLGAGRCIRITALLHRQDTLFVNHSASSYGGTILARFSNVSWSGVTSFESSTLRARLESGGTVQVEHSALFVAGRDVI